MKNNSIMLTNCGTMEKKERYFRSLLSKMSKQDKQDTIFYAENLLKKRKELSNAAESSSCTTK